MRLTLQVEPHGWGRLEFADTHVATIVRVSNVSDVFADVIDAIAAAAAGAESVEAYLGLEPGLATVRISRHDEAWSRIEIDVGDHWGAHGAFSFPFETRSLAKLGLEFAATVDRETYLDAWAPQVTWPTESLEGLRDLAQ
ncbi:hypothetical protein GCM10009798_25600 [Nocardioides panacihumi]|uniref:Uncharacterized protein n=1 Tax=Nocardioides panacihumi TaxID=400774 RepID=A0ABN2R6E6_9ACTN